jgi:hypothetical protein
VKSSLYDWLKHGYSTAFDITQNELRDKKGKQQEEGATRRPGLVLLSKSK